MTQERENTAVPWGLVVVSILLGGLVGLVVGTGADNPPTGEETPVVIGGSPLLVLAGSAIALLIASLASPRLRAATWTNPSRRFNWIVLLVLGLGAIGIGVLGVRAGDGTETIPWFAMGVGLLAGALVLKLMRLP